MSAPKNLHDLLDAAYEHDGDTFQRIEELRAEVAAIVAHFKERPVIVGKATEEDARWIMRYDAAKAELAKLRL